MKLYEKDSPIPDLLDALRAVLAASSNGSVIHASHDWQTCDQPSCVMARAAIAKAEGLAEPEDAPE